MSARLELKRSIAPNNIWHWVIIFDNGHIWCVSDKSFKTAEECIKDAEINAIVQLIAADSL